MALELPQSDQSFVLRSQAAGTEMAESCLAGISLLSSLNKNLLGGRQAMGRI